jgi:hypothetical protein
MRTANVTIYGRPHLSYDQAPHHRGACPVGASP